MTYDPTTWNHEDVITSQKLNKIEKGLTDVAESAIFGFGGAQQSSDGLTPFSYINAGDPMPSNPKKGDTVFIKDGNDFTIYSYDGEQWNIKVDPNLSQRLSDTLKEAKDSTDKAIADNNDQINNTVNEVAKEKIDLAIKDADFNNKAQAMADKALADAKANTAQMAQEALNSANKHLADAKTDLTKSIASEASQAVAAANSQAQNYVNQAKKDINDTINALSVGGRNYVLNSNVSTTSEKLWFYSSVPSSYFNHKKLTVSVQVDYDNITALSSPERLGVEFIILNKDGSNRYVGSWKYPTIGDSFHGRISTTWDFSNNEFKDYSNNQMGGGIFVQGITGTNVSVSKPKLEIGTKATDWTSAPEDVVLDYTTKDNKIKETITQYQDTNDRHVSKLQTDVTTALGQIVTKISQTDYDKKTGELSKKVNEAKDTADKSLQTIGDYKTSNDKRVHDAESSIERTANSITEKVSRTDYDKKTGELTHDLSELKHTADGFEATVTKVNNLSVGGRNLLLGTEQFTGDWYRWRWYGTWDADPYNGHKAVQTNNSFGGPKYVIHDLFSRKVVEPNTDYTLSVKIKNTSSTPIDIYFYSSIPSAAVRYIKQLPPNSDWTTISTTFQFPDINPNTDYGLMRFEPTSSVTSGQGTIIQTEMKFERGNIVTDWTPAPEDIESALAQVKTTADGVSSIVSDPTKGLSTRVQTAEGTLNKVSGTDIPALQNATFWQPYSSLNFNDYTKQGSFFFNTTAAKQNGPTTSNAWTYLIVEQGTSAKDRIKQTAWYDGVTGVKITYVRTLNSGTWSPWYANDNDSVTTISQTNSDVRQEIADRKNGDSNTLQSSKDFTQSSITSYDKGMQTQLTQTASGILAQVESTNMVVNSEFDPLNGTFYRLTNDGSTGSQLAEAWNAPAAGSFTDWPVVNGSRIVSYAERTWYTSALVSASAGKPFSASIVAGRSPAPTVSTALDFRIGFWDSSRKLLTTASAGNIIDGTAYKGAQKYVVENRTAPANTAFVSIIIAHSSASATDYITRPSLNTGDKASPYTPTYGTSSSSTVLSLFKDNWSIGITDNISKITSGIVGNASQMSLISKNVTIDSPNTQIKGTAWIQSAMIANGAIGSAQIGDATITSAKIAQLDVAKLTGNVSSFIQSNWNGVYGSTYITADGMSVSSGTVTTSFGAQGMRITMASNEGVVIQGSTRSNGTQTGVLIGMNVGSTFTSFGFQSSTDYLYNDEMVILKNGSAAAGDYNIGGGVAFNHNVSLMDNVFIKNGKGFFLEWGKSGKALFMATINRGIPALITTAGAGIAFGPGGQLYAIHSWKWYEYGSSLSGSVSLDYDLVTGTKR